MTQRLLRSQALRKLVLLGLISFPGAVGAESADPGAPPEQHEDLPPESVVTSSPPAKEPPLERKVEFGDWLGYNSAESNTTWLAGGDFGMFSMESFPTLELGKDAAIVVGTGFHFLNGPVTTDLPPRLFDFQAAFHVRKAVTPGSMLDIKLGVGAFSDFETSARKGIRFPGHAVSYTAWDDQFVSVFGVDVLDRDDISLLPVAGFVWRPIDDMIFELVFPRPRVQLQLNNHRSMYLGGELGGGTWAIERADQSADNATYRDLRITWGIMDFDHRSSSSLEIGWAFDRELEYRSGIGNQEFDGAFILRFQSHY